MRDLKKALILFSEARLKHAVALVAPVAHNEINELAATISKTPSGCGGCAPIPATAATTQISAHKKWLRAENTIDNNALEDAATAATAATAKNTIGRTETKFLVDEEFEAAEQLRVKTQFDSELEELRKANAEVYARKSRKSAARR